ncbi:unnamed protein product [Rotaria socialis]|uniref:RRM domain-containing protein n=1 Tax=Rotaria socialis TaxID=392032 RepID=A0A818L421_9BILA|nr:unnamed protein product [Rotaria socialis]
MLFRSVKILGDTIDHSDELASIVLISISLTFSSTKRALDTMNFDLLYGRPLRIMWSQRAPDLRKTGVGNVFIKHLDKRIDSKLLYDTFSTFGNILSCKIMRNESGESCGFGFIHFETQEAADMAINKMNGTFLVYKKSICCSFPVM